MVILELVCAFLLVVISLLVAYEYFVNVLIKIIILKEMILLSYYLFR